MYVRDITQCLTFSEQSVNSKDVQPHQLSEKCKWKSQRDAHPLGSLTIPTAGKDWNH